MSGFRGAAKTCQNQTEFCQGFVSQDFSTILVHEQPVTKNTVLVPVVSHGVCGTTVAHGGDTDTNAAICGALVGAAQGRDAVPLRLVGKMP
ncbi:ADP-ribosylglycohydrolase family protein [Phaeobacter inhibens]|uniref:ADP-ribosylglycohydrolase family protein n=1 Tax=Phaeobacter inhibens TaxID=221822 RepID=UPI0035CD008F